MTFPETQEPVRHQQVTVWGEVKRSMASLQQYAEGRKPPEATGRFYAITRRPTSSHAWSWFGIRRLFHIQYEKDTRLSTSHSSCRFVATSPIRLLGPAWNFIGTVAKLTWF